jgi:hypothetical protein
MKRCVLKISLLNNFNVAASCFKKSNNFFQELKTLSKSCQEIMSCPANPGDESNDEALRERQVNDQKKTLISKLLYLGKDL